ncbi:MAG TPA: S-layer homology domain-containing protein [Thermoanaerobaculia bacterium]|nr:S-layer homology domain-containing protein [Thermoanaerobaculia bacterium]
MKTSRSLRALTVALGLALAGTSGASFAGTLTVRPGVPNVGGQARYSGTHGLQVDVATPNTAAAYVQSSHPSGETSYRARFFVNLRKLVMANGDELDLFVAYDGADPVPPATTGNTELRIVVRKVGADKVLSAFATLDGGSEVEIPATVTLANGWRMVEFNWSRATAVGANNGRLDLWVDGVPRTGLTTLDNDTGSINYSRWGTATGVDAGTSGQIDMDDFASQRSGYMGPIQLFADVPPSDPLYRFVQGLYAAEVTAGCGGGNFCPTANVTRDQMAIFLERGSRGPLFVPPTATGIFADVPPGAFAADFIEQLFSDGITAGCSSSPMLYCPTANVTRDQMAVFLLRAKHGPSYVPPAATGTVFADVPANAPFAAFIEQLAAEGITAGCGGGNYCPASPVTRSNMAVFLDRTFGFPTQEIGP